MSLFSFIPSEQLTFANAEADRKRLFDLYANSQEDICCDLSSVSHCDSAGLALLIEAKRLARKHGKVCQFLGMSKEIEVLAQFCGVNHMLCDAVE